MSNQLDNNYNVKAYDAQDNEFLVFANRFKNEDSCNWKGWSCAAGSEHILVEFDLSVYSGECKNDYLGNLDNDFSLLTDYTTCVKEQCTGCTSDLTVTKFK